MADSSLLASLLDVQAHDIAADQLRHRRATLPERTELAQQEAAVARLDAELAGVRDRAGELHRAQRRLEDEVAGLESKGEETNRKLYSGTVTAPRELQSLQEEVAALGRRQSSLEDDLLDVMEAVEPVVAELSRLEAERDAAAGQADRLRASIAEAEAAIDAELEVVLAERDESAAALPGDLLATYDRLRAHLDGVAVARLENGRCTGCHLALPATELDAVRRAPEDALVRHEECGRILVR